MTPKSSPPVSLKAVGKKIDKASLKKVKDEVPLFAGLDDYILDQAIREKEEAATADKAKAKEKALEKKKKTALKTKQHAVEPKTKRAPKVKKAQPLDPDAILLSVAEMCTLLKISRATLVRMDNAGKLPGRIKLGGSVRFHRQTVETWLQGLIATPPSA